MTVLPNFIICRVVPFVIGLAEKVFLVPQYVNETKPMKILSIP
jgi:hypothetical protein